MSLLFVSFELLRDHRLDVQLANVIQVLEQIGYSNVSNIAGSPNVHDKNGELASIYVTSRFWPTGYVHCWDVSPQTSNRFLKNTYK